MAKARISEVRDGLLLSTKCRSRYKERSDKCRYCEIDFKKPGISCPMRELCYKHNFADKTGLDVSNPLSNCGPLDILTYAALENWPEYADYIGADELRAEVMGDIKKHIPETKLEKVLARYPFLVA